MFRHNFVVLMCSSKLCLYTLMTNILVRCDLCEAGAYLLYMLASLCLNCILNFVVVLLFMGKQVANTCISKCLPLMEQMETQFRCTLHAGLVDFYMMECE